MLQRQKKAPLLSWKALKRNVVQNILKPQSPGKKTGQIWKPILNIRRLIYTINATKIFNRQLRKVTKAEAIVPSDVSLLKMLYLAMMDITKNGLGTARTGANPFIAGDFP